jgi:glycosyltransferase involved in cell wall biosynthesis
MPRGWVDEVIVVDGGSRDATVAEAGTAGATVLVEKEPGYGRACARGAAAAGAGRAEILVFLDGDGGDRPEAIPTLVQPIIEDKYDFVIGSRTRGVREKGSMGAHQALAGYIIGAAIGLVYAVRYTDMCAFRAIRTDALARLGMREPTGWNRNADAGGPSRAQDLSSGAVRSASAGNQLPVPWRHLKASSSCYFRPRRHERR